MAKSFRQSANLRDMTRAHADDVGTSFLIGGCRNPAPLWSWSSRTWKPHNQSRYECTMVTSPGSALAAQG